MEDIRVLNPFRLGFGLMRLPKSTPLYYNPNGGEYYHRDQNCRDVNPKFLPLAGTFTFGQINDEPYSKLKRCNVCGAPLRPTQQQ